MNLSTRFSLNLLLHCIPQKDTAAIGAIKKVRHSL